MPITQKAITSFLGGLLGLGTAALLATDGSIRLLNITSQVSGQASAILIEVSEPVGYTASQPDPLTILVDLRGAAAGGANNAIARGGRGPIAGVSLEERPTDVGPSKYVRIRLSRPVPYRVRSARSVIRIEFVAEESPAHGVVSTGPTIASPGGLDRSASDSATALTAIGTAWTAEGPSITLSGNGRLLAGAVQLLAGPHRLFFDLNGVTAAVPALTVIDRDPIQRVRVATNSRSPLVTRVVVDLSGPVRHRIVPSGPDGRDLRLVLTDTGRADGSAAILAADAAIDPMTALQTDLPLLSPLAAIESTAANEPPVPAAAETNLVSARTRVASAEPLLTSVPLSISLLRQAPPAGSDSAPQPGPADAAQPSTTNVTFPLTSVVPPVMPVSAAAQVTQATQPGPPTTPQPGPILQTPGALVQTAQGDRQFTGNPVTLDFQNADLRSVLRTFAEISGLNIVIDPAVQGTVDVSLHDVPWDQALDIILRANKLGYTVDGTIIRIAPITVLSDEEAQRRKLAEEQALSGQLNVLTKTLSYARAANLAQLVTRTALSQRGTVQVDERTNTLIITDLQSRLDTASRLIATLDRPEPQVEIEARIVQTTREFARAIGVQWGINGRVAQDLANTTSLTFPNRGTLTGRTGSNQVPQDPRATVLESTASAVNLPAANANSAIGLALGAINGAFNLDIALSALERNGKGRVLSTPRVSTQNNVEAQVTQGIQIPIQTVANNTVTVTFKDAALTLRVTPQITSADTVIMRIELENATPDFSRQVNGIPPINTQRANTQVQVDNGATTVIGGIFVSSEQSTKDTTPGLARIPILGWLFKRDTITDESRELLIFVTPRIIKG